jgi:taurine dioxygenase
MAPTATVTIGNADMAENAKKGDITIIPIHENFCADIVGFDFDAMPSHQVDTLRKAWLKYSVLRFRGYDISDQHQLAFNKLIGSFLKRDTQVEQDAEVKSEGNPYNDKIKVMSNVGADGNVTASGSNAELEWHTDSWYFEYPPVGEVLHAIKVPTAGGDTYWADMYGIYNALSDSSRKVIEGRLIQFDIVYDGHNRLRKGQEAPKTDDHRQWANVRHPIIRTHPESGRKAVYIGCNLERNWIVGLPLDESATILREIMKYVERPEFQFHQVWQPGDMILWDDRCTMHRRDGWAGGDVRIMHRTSCDTRGQPRPYYVC